MKATGNRYLLFTVFVSGMVVLGIEISAQRLVGNVFGSSNLVWANIIGLMLLYLAAGYFIGGRWADRSPNLRTFYTILAVGAFLAGVTPLIAQPVLRFAAVAMGSVNLALLGGSFVGTLLLFAAPVTLLGCASPFAVRLAVTDAASAGSASGRIYAVSTMGSLLGTFLPVLVLVPMLGTRGTFLTLSGVLLLVALIGLWRADPRRGALALALPVVLAMATWLSPATTLRPIEALYPGAQLVPGSERESSYNFIQVAQAGDTRWLFLNDSLIYHSIYNPNGLRTGGTFDLFLVAPFFNAAPVTENDVRSLALVGLAAGTVSKQYTAVYGPIPIDGIEIDPAVVEVGRRYFDMNEPNLNVIVGDGRWELEQLEGGYSVIGVDAYRPPYIPWQLTTREFFAIVHERLADDGVLVINVGRTPGDRSLVEALVGTLGAVFPSVYVVDVPNTGFNSMVYATKQVTDPANLAANLGALPGDAHPLLRAALGDAVANLKPTPTSATVFTDDWAPVEQYADAIVLGYFLNGDTSDLGR
ncbi:MAG TPA: fused MFS/spermidine synthase [Anaerolineales bacterium]|nr:fused MFS/spermidine synthase [Anaerolineales bacterium]